MVYPVEEVTNIQKCDFSPKCKSLGYIILGDEQPWIKYSIDHIANKSRLSREDDFRKIYEGGDAEDAFASIQNDTDYEYSTILLYCSSVIQFKGFFYPCNANEHNYVYWLLYNATLVRGNMLDNMNSPRKASIEAMRTARQVENSLANWILKSTGFNQNPRVEHNFTIQNYPRVQSNIFAEFDTSSEQFSFWFFLPIMISFLSFMSEVLREKE